MNDTLAIIGTPIVLAMARRHQISPILLLLALAFSVTVGSVISPIGNPQNLLIAISGPFTNPFVTFLRFLFLPTAINLLLTYLALKLFFADQFHATPLIHSEEVVTDHHLAKLGRVSLVLIVVLIFVKTIAVIGGSSFEIKLTYIALVAAFPILAASPRRLEVLKRIDWATLVFFAAMFILMASVWNSGFLQKLIEQNLLHPTSLAAIMIVSTVVSQFVSNVPLVALYLPILLKSGAGDKELIALAAGSTIAGNLLILGAASNVIIIQNAERRSGISLSFLQFAKIGLPLTIVQAMIYWLFLRTT
jgi:Na+/H+ antiporter NhaD/arsenite permease-like protein